MKAKTKNSEPVKNKRISFRLICFYVFRGITFPLYLTYLILFKIPDVPAKTVGLLRFSFFVTLTIYSAKIEFFLKNLFEKTEFPDLGIFVFGIFSIVMLINLFLSFMEIFGFHDATKSGIGFYESKGKNNKSNFDAFNEAIEYRDSLLRNKHTPDKIEELKKTGFITNERVLSLNSSPEINEAFELANSQMRALHTLGKYNFLKNMFGGK